MTSKRKARTKRFPYQDAARSPDARVCDLLPRMTLDEKIRQLGMHNCLAMAKNGKYAATRAAAHLGRDGIGALQDPRLDVATNVALVNAVQKHLIEKTRLGIPALIIAECLHGHMSGGATMFPQAIGLASTWNPSLIKRMAAAAAREARAVGVTQALGPDLDLAREPRWGRVEETYGEDPYLCGKMGVAYVEGLQGTAQTVGQDHLVATVKHFAAHGSPQGGINLAPVAVGPRELRDTYLPPFKACVKAGALSVMPAYSEYDGTPCHASRELLTTILRNEWRFRGYVFADYMGVEFLRTLHRTAATDAEAGKQALEAGLDLEAPGIQCFGDKLRELVESGEVAMDTVDAAVARVLLVKFLAGLFENPYAAPQAATKIIHCDEHRKLARRIAQESIVLLKNQGGFLPLDKRKLKSIAVIGPNADRPQLGDYSLNEVAVVTPYRGLKAAAGKRIEVSHAAGCGIWEPSTRGFDDAVAAAATADVAVVVVGDSSAIDAGVGWGIEDPDKLPTCGEGFDRTDLGLPGVQQQLVEAVVGTGTPTVVILVNGRPHTIPWIQEHATAVLEAWYPGEQGGNAIADVLFGNVNPSGKLPITFPARVGQIPVYQGHKPSARGAFYRQPGSPDKPGRDYVFTSPEPLYKFGFGLSYTTFKYSRLTVAPATLNRRQVVTVSVDVTNTGQRAGSEVVQLYIDDVVSSVTTPVKVLRGFRKIRLTPGQTRTVTFRLQLQDLSLWNAELQEVVEPGEFAVMIGELKKTLRVSRRFGVPGNESPRSTAAHGTTGNDS